MALSRAKNPCAAKSRLSRRTLLVTLSLRMASLAVAVLSFQLIDLNAQSLKVRYGKEKVFTTKGFN